MKNVLLWLVRLFGCAVGFAVLLWCGASLYFLIAGRDIAPPNLSRSIGEPAFTATQEGACFVREGRMWYNTPPQGAET